jgi:hypothetical protein
VIKPGLTIIRLNHDKFRLTLRSICGLILDEKYWSKHRAIQLRDPALFGVYWHGGEIHLKNSPQQRNSQE